MSKPMLSCPSSTPSPVSLLGIHDLHVVAVWEFAAERQVVVQTGDGQRVFCRGCGVRAESKGRDPVSVRDLPAAGKATRLVWIKRLWRCYGCQSSWRELHAEIPPRAVLTERARAEAARQVGEANRSVAAVAREFGVGWETVMRAVRDTAATMFANQQVHTVQTRPCVALGVDEKVMNRAAPRRRRTYVTVIVDLARRRTLDIVPGRSKAVLKAWLAAQTPSWRAGVKIVSLDPYAGYRAALVDPAVGLAGAQLVVDRFHAEKLANTAIDDARRRVQQETTGHRGRSGDPLYGIRRVLLTAADRLTDRGRARLDVALAAGDPFDEVGCTWVAKELTRRVFTAPDIFAARLELERLFDFAAEVEVAEVTRLATTLNRWRVELLAYHRTGRTTSGPVEAINGEHEAVDRVARGFRNSDNYRTRMLLKTAVIWHTPATPRLRGRHATVISAAPSFIA
jgi:transposase